MPFNRHLVQIHKRATDCVFGAVGSYNDLRLYSTLYARLQARGDAADNEAWKKAIAREWRVRHRRTQ